MNAITFLWRELPRNLCRVKISCRISEGPDRDNCYFGFAPSASNRQGPALNCPAGSRPSARTYELTWFGPVLPNLGRPD